MFIDEDPEVKVTKIGLKTLINASQQRGHAALFNYLTAQIEAEPVGKVLVHRGHRKQYIDLRKLNKQQDDYQPSPKKLRSCTTQFEWKTDCLFCGKPAIVEYSHPDKDKISSCQTLELRERILKHCDTRKDKWRNETRHRVFNCNDLVHVEGVYHKDCRVRFFLDKETLLVSPPKPKGRPQDPVLVKSFGQICAWLEGSTELYTLKEVHKKMKEFAGDNDTYSVKWLKTKLKDKYKDHIYFTEEDGCKNIVCFKNTASLVINDQWYADRCADTESEMERIVLSAAKIIKAKIKEQEYDIGKYPSDEQIGCLEKGRSWLPKLLLDFLKTLIKSDTKQVSIGQCIVQAARPRSVIAPLLFGLGVEADSQTGCRWLVDELSRLGFSVTSDEVTRYKQSVLQSDGIGNVIPDFNSGAFTQWVADNVDHNTATLDGKATFHGMGIIAATSYNSRGESERGQGEIIRRLKKRLLVKEAVEGKEVPLFTFIRPKKPGISEFTFRPILHLKRPYVLPSTIYSDLLWQSGWIFSSEAKPRPNWTGFMQLITSAESAPPKSDVFLLPIIDLSPTDENCIYSTLKFIESQAQMLNIKTPCITFDQPLWYKAVGIIRAKQMNTVCRLGGFHMLMSFLGSVGNMMAGSGLEEMFEQCYATNVIPHLMSGKAISRALRAHFMVESALEIKLLEVLTERDKQEDSRVDVMSREDWSETQDLFNRCLLMEASLTEIENSEVLGKLHLELETVKEKLSAESRTSKLWIQYINYIKLIKMFIRAERTGDWHMHLIAAEQMLNLFAATGHIHYAKSSRLYLQLMHDLPTDYPWLFEAFEKHGFHTVRRSERYWSGLWTDLTIEQVLMRSIKTRGGLTRGRGMTDTVRHQWVHTAHRTAAVHDAMTNFTGLKSCGSEQHVELGSSRMKRDYADMNKMVRWLDDRNPFFGEDARLRSLSTGAVAQDGDKVNCDCSEDVGRSLHQRLDNASVHEAKMKRKDQLVPLDFVYNTIRVDKKEVYINPTTLFVRLVAIAQREEDVSQYFQYELSAYPTSLFKDGYMRKPVKPKLRQSLVDETVNVREGEGEFVLDGGALLHKVRWQRRSTYKDVAQQYVTYVNQKFGQCHVVFDGYDDGPAIKDHEHQRRSIGKKASAEITIEEANVAQDQQNVFLGNETNKSKFIGLLAKYLRLAGHLVKCCTGDADVEIVATAIDLAKKKRPSIVVADDTDIIILLIYHWEVGFGDVFFKSEKAMKTWSVSDVVEQLGCLKCHVLFLHAWTGCDSTSAIFGHGKTSLINNMRNSQELQELSQTMSDYWADQEAVGRAGIRLFIIMYGGRDIRSLNKLRYEKFNAIAMVFLKRILHAFYLTQQVI